MASTYLVLETERGLISCAVRNFTEVLNVLASYERFIDLSTATISCVVAESHNHRNAILEKRKAVA